MANSSELLKQSFPLEIGFAELNAISFDKGCYVGQEVTTRMKIRKLVKKRLVPVTFDGKCSCTWSSQLSKFRIKPLARYLLPITRSGLAMIRLETLDQALNGGLRTRF